MAIVYTCRIDCHNPSFSRCEKVRDKWHLHELYRACKDLMIYVEYLVTSI